MGEERRKFRKELTAGNKKRERERGEEREDGGGESGEWAVRGGSRRREGCSRW